MDLFDLFHPLTFLFWLKISFSTAHFKMTLILFDQITFVHQTGAEIQNLTLFQKELFIPKKMLLTLLSTLLMQQHSSCNKEISTFGQLNHRKTA